MTFGSDRDSSGLSWPTYCGVGFGLVHRIAWGPPPRSGSSHSVARRNRPRSSTFRRMTVQETAMLPESPAARPFRKILSIAFALGRSLLEFLQPAMGAPAERKLACRGLPGYVRHSGPPSRSLVSKGDCPGSAPPYPAGPGHVTVDLRESASRRSSRL